MAVKTYVVNDEWKDINKANKISAYVEDGEVQGVFLNGEELGGGGGGDFSIAEVTITNATLSDVDCGIPYINQDYDDSEALRSIPADDERICAIILYKGTAYIYIDSEDIEVTGGVSIDDGIIVTGDGTITIH